MESQGDFITFRVAAFVLRRQRKEILVSDADTDAFLVTKVLENIHADTGILRRRRGFPYVDDGGRMPLLER